MSHQNSTYFEWQTKHLNLRASFQMIDPADLKGAKIQKWTTAPLSSMSLWFVFSLNPLIEPNCDFLVWVKVAQCIVLNLLLLWQTKNWILLCLILLAMCNNHDYHHVGGFLHNKSSVKVIQFLKATFGWLEFHSHTLKVKVTRMPQNLREKVQACRHISRAIFVIFIAQPVLKSALSQQI